MSIIVAELTPSLDSAVAAMQSVNVTVSKLAKATKSVPSSKSSTIHSAFWPPSAEVEVRSMVATSPVVKFSIVALPVVVVVAMTEALITWTRLVL